MDEAEAKGLEYVLSFLFSRGMVKGRIIFHERTGTRKNGRGEAQGADGVDAPLYAPAVPVAPPER